MAGRARRDLSLPLKNYLGGGLSTRAVTTVYNARVFSAFGSHDHVIIMAGPFLRTVSALTERQQVGQWWWVCCCCVECAVAEVRVKRSARCSVWGLL
jgi:hypothetical protein